MKKLIFIAIVCVFMTIPVMADMGGGTIYFNFAGKLYTWDPVNGKVPVGDWPGTSNDGAFWVPDSSADGKNFGTTGTDKFTDIAFDTDGKLYGVNTWDPSGGVNTGSFWSIDSTTAEIKYLTSSFGAGGNIADKVTALSNYDTHKFYAAVDGSTYSPDNPVYDSGHLYDWTWDATTMALSGTDIGKFQNAINSSLLDGEVGLDGSYKFVSTGDLWYRSGVLYGTVTALDAASAELKYLLATVDTTNAELTFIANLDPWTTTTYGPDPDGSAGPLPKPPVIKTTAGHGGNLFQAMTDWNSNVAVLREDGYLFYWNGSSNNLLGTNIIWTGIDVGCAEIRGATSVPVPVPGAVLLGILGLGAAGIKLRKFA